jgi:hypothetical protein
VKLSPSPKQDVSPRHSSGASREISGFVLDQFGFDTLTMRYRMAEAELEGVYPGLPPDEDFVRNEHSVMDQVSFGARYQRPEGFFASWESAWTQQSDSRDAAEMTGDNFWRHDLWVGWRFLRRKVELAVGILNLTDEDYRLYPLNYFGETYRERTVAVTGSFAF